jgi:hypothetical protein
MEFHDIWRALKRKIHKRKSGQGTERGKSKE